MKCFRPIGLVLMTLASWGWCVPTTVTTARSTSPHGQTYKTLTKQLLDFNSTTMDVLDVRTPPKIQQQQKNKMKHRNETRVENSHAGIAIPVDEDAVAIEEATKKMNFYKIERPTTNSGGLATWIRVESHITTPKPTAKKPVIKPTNEDVIIEDNPSTPSGEEKSKDVPTVIVEDKPNRIIKPVFRKRGSTTTTEKPTTKSTVPTTTTKVAKETTKLTKIKASDLNTAVNKKNHTTTTASSAPKKTSRPTLVSSATTEAVVSSTVIVPKKNVTNVVDSSTLPLEPKNEEVDLSNNIDDKKKKGNKRKKNKNRRRKPAEKSENNNNLSKPGTNQEKISTQLYNYLAREIMPTVGAGLVGLVVTAGLATYFLYPFGIARRSDDIDRKDKEGSYYYSDDYSGGMLEEEAIGKVIAGMTVNSFTSNSYKPPTTRSPYNNVHNKYTLADRRANIQTPNYEGFVKGSVENVPLGPDDYQPYKNSVNDNKKFVVGNVPKEFEDATPVTVPEHGPRHLKIQEEKDVLLLPAYGPRSIVSRRKRNTRRKRSTEQNDTTIRKQRSGISNELDGDLIPEDTTAIPDAIEELKTSTILTTTTTDGFLNTSNTTEPSFHDKVVTFFDMMRECIHIKTMLGLQVLKNATQHLSSYITDVQRRLEDHYSNSTRHN